jgi:hypothetical protein
MKPSRLLIASSLVLVAVVPACGGRTPLSEVSSAAVDQPETCQAPALTCVQPAAADPCGAPTTVAATCDLASLEWVCLPGSRPYQRASATSDRCLPFHGANSGVASLGGSLVRVPTDDGRCLWIGEDVTFTDGSAARNVVFEVDPTAPFGTCPAESVTPPVAVVTVEGPADPSVLVQIDGGYRLGGATHVLYRIFTLDPTAGFGVREQGGGVARWDPASQKIVVPAPGNYPWGLDLDLGDAMVVQDDTAYVFGCGQSPEGLLESCSLATLDAQDRFSVVGRDVFQSGPWVSSVVASANGSGFLHLYVSGFGSRLQTHVAAALPGPWTDGAGRGSCDLPSGDGQAFCAGPVVHTELADPTRPDELPVTYGVGTTGTRQADPDAYWTRLVWR